MKRLLRFARNDIFILIFVISLFFFPSLAHSAHSPYEPWFIPEYHVTVNIRTDGSFHVTEEITADFTDLPRHGIFRFIPYLSGEQPWQKTSIRLKNFSVTDQNGQKWQFEQSKKDGNVFLKIGDPDVLRSEKLFYRIEYDVERAMLFLEDHDELYWNVNGTEWPVIIESLTARVLLPKDMPEPALLGCFKGPYGSKQDDCYKKQISDREIFFEASYAPDAPVDDFTIAPMGPYENLTIVLGFPKGMIVPPTSAQKIWWFLSDNFGYFIPLPFFIFLFSLWYLRGRDPSHRIPIVPHYTPPDNLTPAEIGAIRDETVDPRDISAELIRLAIKGYVHIKEISSEEEASARRERAGQDEGASESEATEDWPSSIINQPNDYELILKKFDFRKDRSLANHEIFLLSAVFGRKEKTKISSLKHKFYDDFKALKEKIYSDLVEKGYFPRNPEKHRNIYQAAGVVIFMFALYLGFNVSFPIGIGLFITGILYMAFGSIMPRKTVKGAETLAKIRGLEMYIETAEKDRIEFQEKHGILFEKLLPYAISLRLADTWAKKFSGIYTAPPDWYEGSYSFSTISFASHMALFNSFSGSAFSSAPSNGGSGGGGSFSGGGGGGGGGGSW